MSVIFGRVLLGRLRMNGCLAFGLLFQLFVVYIIRKPGAAVLSETITATIEVMIGNAVKAPVLF